MTLINWIGEATAGCRSVVEFGAGLFEMLKYVAPSVETKIGIEAHKPYIDAAKYRDCEMRLGDFLKFEELTEPWECDCALFVDSLEHVTKEEAVDLIGRVQSSFSRIALMVPEGNHPQTGDAWGMGGEKWQTHRSSWTVSDVAALGFQEIVVDPEFHAERGGGKDHGCIFAVWRGPE